MGTIFMIMLNRGEEDKSLFSVSYSSILFLVLFVFIDPIKRIWGLMLERLNMNHQVESGQIFPANFRVNGPETVSVLPVNIAFGKVFFFF